MKWIITIPAILLFALAGCGKDKQSTNELITVDVTVSYPKKELILQDFMDVEYIPLETKDDFICQGLVLAIGKDIILARNRIRDGDIFIYQISSYNQCFSFIHLNIFFNMFHVEHFVFYLPSSTKRMLMSLGEIPGMRLA